MKISSQKVLNGLVELEEEQLTSDVIRPLLEVIHPGRIEYTHSSIEAGRDLVSFGRDCLSRSHILCVQVKALKLSFGAAPFKDVINAVEVALKTKVTLEDGEMSFPSEVWVITSHPFPEQKRRQLFDYLNELSRRGIKVIAGEELTDLLIKNNPDVATWLSKYSSTEIINFLSELSEHKEAKAFGFSVNRNIEDFYITTTLSPYITNTTLAINNKFRLKNFDKKFSLPVRKLLRGPDILQDDKKIISCCVQNISGIENGYYFRGVEVITKVSLEDSVQKIKEKFLATFNLSIKNFIKSSDIFYQLKTKKKAIHKFIYKHLSPDLKGAVDKFKKNIGLGTTYSEMLVADLNKILLNPDFSNEDLVKEINLTEETRFLIEKITDTKFMIVRNRYILDELFSQDLIKTNESKESEITGEIFFDLEATLKDLVDRSNAVIKDCPKELDKNTTKIKNTIDFLSRAELFFKNIPNELRLGDKFVSQNNEMADLGLRIQIVAHENLLKLDRLLLIEGFPGCGKTTLLKILTIKLLNLNKKVLYLPCFKINPNYKDKSFKEIIQDFALGANQIQGNKVEDFILVIDGLDESPFILSDKILKNVDKFANVIVSTRITFNTSLRSSFLQIAVAPFSSDERNEFFSRWFGEKSDLMKKSKELIKKYRDIDVHTRIPLIATIAVALIQRGFQPTTRAEIYRDRLDLLLSNWDKFRGVKRLQIDYPDAKKRFLMELAFRIHSDEIRTRKSEDKSVLRGRQVFFEELLDIYEDSLGKWGYGVSYQKIFDDLVLCGILIEERPKIYSFGHLTFQEHLVGEYISENFSVNQIVELLGSDWWKEPLNFYSSIKGDITKLIELTLNSSSFLANVRQIHEMSKFAPYTSPGAIDCVKEAIYSVVNSQNLNLEDL